MIARHTDSKKGRFERREERLFRRGFDWYYHIRDGQRGPFPTREAASADLAEYLSTVRFLEEHADRLPEDIDVDDLTHIEIEPPQY